MTAFTIDEVSIPAVLDSPDAADFIAAVDVRNAVDADGYGTKEMNYSAAELFPRWRDQSFEPKRLFAARIGGRVVARAVIETRWDEQSDAAWLQVQVLPEFRRRGVGTALSDELESIAGDEGRRKMLVYTVSKDGPGERLASPTGFGSVPRANAEVQFLLGRGYSLEQVERGSRLALPVDGDLRQRLDAAAESSGPDYRVRYWVDRTPAGWREDVAMLLTRMSTEAPSAGLEEPEDAWSVDRLIADEEKEAASPRKSFAAAVEHVPSGRLVGFTELSVPAELDRPVSQEDTLVLREHRGHRLGMLLKIANLVHLHRERPGHPSVTTFNAEENRHMLSVNEAVGFVLIGYEGGWRKTLEM